MGHTIRVDSEVYAYINELASRLSIAAGRPVSMSDAVMFSLAWVRCLDGN